MLSKSKRIFRDTPTLEWLRFCKNRWITSEQCLCIAKTCIGDEGASKVLADLFPYVIDRENFDAVIEELFPKKNLYFSNTMQARDFVLAAVKNHKSLEDEYGWNHPSYSADSSKAVESETEEKPGWFSSEFYRAYKEEPKSFAASWFLIGVGACAWMDLCFNLF
jgi:hypothetical protein